MEWAHAKRALAQIVIKTVQMARAKRTLLAFVALSDLNCAMGAREARAAPILQKENAARGARVSILSSYNTKRVVYTFFQV